MTRSSSNKPIHTPGRYYYKRGSDGCDSTFDVHNGHNQFIIATHFWDEEAEAEATARLITNALNAYMPDSDKQPSRKRFRITVVNRMIEYYEIEADNFEDAKDRWYEGVLCGTDDNLECEILSVEEVQSCKP